MFPESSNTSLIESYTLPTFRIIGDSIVSQCDTASVPSASATSSNRNAAITRYPRWWTWVLWLTGNALNYHTTLSIADWRRKGSNSGIGGDDLLEIAARLPALLASMPERHLVFHCATNSLNAGVSLSDLITQSVNLLTITRAAGKVPIWTTALPRNAVDGANDWGATVTTAAQKRLTLAAYNSYMARYCRENGIHCVDWYHVFADASGNARTGYTTDGLHPSPRGSYYLAKEFIRQVGHLIPSSVLGHLIVNDDFDATYNPYGNPLNGDFSGTGGATNNAGGVGTITGTVPDNWRVNKSTSTTTSVATAIVSRTDGLPGNVMEFTFTSVGTGASSENWRFEYWSGSTTSLSSYANAGDLLVMAVEVEIVSGHGGVLRGVTPRISGNNVSKTGTTISFDAATQQIRDSANGFGSFVSGRMVNVSSVADPQTPATNRGNFYVETASAGVLQLRSTSGIVDEVAGTNIVVTLPYLSSVGGGASSENLPDDNTGVFIIMTPVSPQIVTGNIVPRIDIFINGTITDTAVVRISRPKLMKLPFTPSLLSFDAHDQ